ILSNGSGLMRTNTLSLSSSGNIGSSTARLSAELVQSKNSSGTVLTPSISAAATAGSIYLQMRGRQRDGSGLAMTVYGDKLTAGNDLDVLLLPAVSDTLSLGFTPGKLHVEVPSKTTLTGDYANRFTTEDGTTTPLSLGIYATTTNTSTIASTYDFRNRSA